MDDMDLLRLVRYMPLEEQDKRRGFSVRVVVVLDCLLPPVAVVVVQLLRRLSPNLIRSPTLFLRGRLVVSCATTVFLRNS